MVMERPGVLYTPIFIQPLLALTLQTPTISSIHVYCRPYMHWNQISVWCGPLQTWSYHSWILYWGKRRLKMWRNGLHPPVYYTKGSWNLAWFILLCPAIFCKSNSSKISAWISTVKLLAQIAPNPKFKYFLYPLAVVFAQSTEAWC